jgi:Flp pilus assembly protein TadG
MRRGRVGRPGNGQAIAEFAIAAVPMLLLLLGIVQFALIYNAQVGLTNAIRDAARVGSTLTTIDNASAATTASTTYSKLTTSLATYVSPYNASNLVTGSKACVSQHADGAGSNPAFVKVTVIYDHPVVIPIVGAILDTIDGTADGAYRITVSTELRIDNPTQAAVSIVGSVCSP